MNPKQELFVRMIKAMGVQDEYKVTTKEAMEENKNGFEIKKDGYIVNGGPGYYECYRYDESFINENWAYVEAMKKIEDSDNMKTIKNWVSFFGFITVLGIIGAVIYLIIISFA